MTKARCKLALPTLDADWMAIKRQLAVTATALGVSRATDTPRPRERTLRLCPNSRDDRRGLLGTVRGFCPSPSWCCCYTTSYSLSLPFPAPPLPLSPVKIRLEGRATAKAASEPTADGLSAGASLRYGGVRGSIVTATRLVLGGWLWWVALGGKL